MKRALTLAVLAALILTLSLPALSATGPCPETSTSTKTNSVVDGDLNEIVLEAGTSFCVKAGDENSGVLTADGVKTLLDYVTWLNRGGQTPDVSHYVVYPPPTTTTTLPVTTTTLEVTTTTLGTTTTTEQVTTTTGPSPTTTLGTTTTVGQEITTTTGPVPTTTGTPTTLSGPSTPAELPYTGFDPVWLAGLALVLGSTGLLLLRSSRVEGADR